MVVIETLKLGKNISSLRKKNGLTQQQLAEKLHVTYQAVSKWERGKSIPDISILQKISKDFGVDLNELLEGNICQKKKSFKKRFWVSIGVLITFFLLTGAYFLSNKESVSFGNLLTKDQNFTIDGIAAYSKDKSAIYISNIDYHGNETESQQAYKVVACTLYEKKEQTDITISQCGNISKEDTKKQEVTTLKELLKNITFHVDNYDNQCKNFLASNLYLKIDALDKENRVVTYRVPLSLDSCS